MTPGPTLIVKCSSCDRHFQQRTIASGNTRRAKFWTDGKMEAPMFPNVPAAASCPHCNSFVWLFELEEIAQLEGNQFNEESSKFAELPHYQELNADQYWEVLESGQLGDEKEAYLRFTLFQLLNDDRRNDEVKPYSPRELENISELLGLTNERNEKGVLIKAELLRCLGKFKEAMAVLELDFGYEYAKQAELIYSLALREDSYVKRIPEDDGELADAWSYRRETKGSTALPFDPSGPPLFHIKSTDVWIKIHGMLQHEWAILEPHHDGNVTVYFFYDCGTTMLRSKQYTSLQLRNRYAVVDSLDFNSLEDAVKGLKRNSFRRHGNGPMVGLGEMPKGNYYDARSIQESCFSDGIGWVNGEDDE